VARQILRTPLEALLQQKGPPIRIRDAESEGARLAENARPASEEPSHAVA
jgi:hypothetical protein